MTQVIINRARITFDHERMTQWMEEEGWSPFGPGRIRKMFNAGYSLELYALPDTKPWLDFKFAGSVRHTFQVHPKLLDHLSCYVDEARHLLAATENWSPHSLNSADLTERINAKSWTLPNYQLTDEELSAPKYEALTAHYEMVATTPVEGIDESHVFRFSGTVGGLRGQLAILNQQHATYALIVHKPAVTDEQWSKLRTLVHEASLLKATVEEEARDFREQVEREQGILNETIGRYNEKLSELEDLAGNVAEDLGLDLDLDFYEVEEVEVDTDTLPEDLELDDCSDLLAHQRKN